MLNNSQISWVKKELKEKGEISRNKCLRNYISRLGAIICYLKKKGWEFKAKYIEVNTGFSWGAKDYVYYLVKAGESNDEKNDKEL